MVKSRISTIEYPEDTKIFPEDKGSIGDVFEIDLFSKDVCITLGKIKYTFIKKGVVYFPIYLVENSKVKQTIGVYEFPSASVTNLFDESGSLDIDQLEEELLFSFAEEAIVDSKGCIGVEELAAEVGPVQKQESLADATEDAYEPVLKVPELPNVNSIPNIFTLKSTSVHELPIETESEANAIVKLFPKHPSSKMEWVQKYFHNPNYKIHHDEIEANGDCFFAVLREAFKQIGMITNVAKLRKLLSENISEQHFIYYQEIKHVVDAQIQQLDTQMSSIKQYLEGTLKKKLKSSKISKSETNSTIEECKNLEKQYKELAQEKRESISTLDELLGSSSSTAFRDIDSFRNHVLKSSFWADEFSILTLEKLLKIKMIILSGDRYQENSIHHVLECGFYDGGEVIQPQYYIIATLLHNHYEIVSYKDKRIFKFHELPYTVKEMISIKCVEKNAGVFPFINEFQQFRNHNTGSDHDDDIPKEPLRTDPDDTIFMFYNKSSNKVKPGNGSGEKIPPKRTMEFKDLVTHNDWRRKLDDSWLDIDNPITIDSKQYASVFHFLESAKYRKQFPDFAKQFSLNSDSDFSKSIDACKEIHFQIDDDEPPVNIDPDFESRKDQEREKALMAKFHTGEMKQILLLTKDAILKRFVPRNPPHTDTILMKVREAIQ